MTRVSGTPASGVVYRYQTKLATGKHTYVFLFADGTSSWTSPISPGIFAGPSLGTALAPATGTVIDPHGSDYSDDDPNG
jgi:hypothetical protein